MSTVNVLATSFVERRKTPRPTTATVAPARIHRERDFGVGYGSSSGYASNRRYAYYYAHLQDYAPGIVEGRQLRRGEVIGHVGSTGNADPAAPHLHFAVFVLGPEKQWWKGTAINPYPLLGGRPAALAGQ